MKAAVYCGTSNLYPDMVTAANSLIVNAHPDKIYFLCEHDNFPLKLDPRIEVINVVNQRYLRMGINSWKRWTYMVLMRAALHLFLPDLDRVLSLDVDTIVDRDISELWDLDLTDCYLAAVPQVPEYWPGKQYVNCGVVMFNLEKLRDGKGDEIIHALNTLDYEFCEQDAINERCQGKILELPPIYNATRFTGMPKDFKIMHYAATANWRDEPLVEKYRR